MLRAVIVAVLINMAVLEAADAKPDISLKVSPQMAFLGRPLMVNVTIKPHPELRGARLQLFPFTDSAWQIDPRKDGGAERRSFVLKIPEPGEYELILAVFDGQGRELARRTVAVKRVFPDES